MPKRLRGRGEGSGGIEGYPLDQLYEEVAFIAYYFHWNYEDVMNMPHWERRKWCEEISKINRKLMNKAGGQNDHR